MQIIGLPKKTCHDPQMMKNVKKNERKLYLR